MEEIHFAVGSKSKWVTAARRPRPNARLNVDAGRARSGAAARTGTQMQPCSVPGHTPPACDTCEGTQRAGISEKGALHHWAR